MEDPQDLVSVYQAANMTEAYFVHNLLVDEGIAAEVTEENEPFAGLPIVPPDVLVKQSDEVRARAIVAEYEKEQEERAQRPDWVCPNCHVNVIGAFDECDNCGADRPTT
jgi:Putative prokaryotic signal transducing protein